MNAETRDEQLRRLLREADPAADAPGLSVEESRAMRRTVLNAAAAEPRRAFLVPALAGAAVVVLAAVVALALWPGSPTPTPPRKPSQRVAAVPRPAPSRPRLERATVDGAAAVTDREPVAASPAGAPEPAPAARTAGRVRQARSTPPDRMANPSPAPLLEETAPDEIETQQVQFSTPGGTRIIWVLTSEKVTE